MLKEYGGKRDFARTPEPAPAPTRDPAEDGPAAKGNRSPLGTTAPPEPPPAPGGCGRFVVHRHRASRLHYDLRLEVGGVLASWALPKGPTRDPDERRFAARTEDHPIEYLDFEGVIAAGNYGAGDSICWDWGTFEPELTWEPRDALRAGELKFRLRGTKLAGRFTLVRTANRDRDRAAGDGPEVEADEGAPWLLIAKAGPEAIRGWDPEAYPSSVRTGRTNEVVAQGVVPRADRPAPAPLPSLDPPGSRRAGRPSFVEPMLATPGTAPFDHDDWLFEPKWDGYRVQAIVADGSVALRTRNRNDAGHLFPELLGKPTWLAAPEAVVDGEVVALDPAGRPDFGLLQARLGGGFSPSDVAAPGHAREAGRAAPLAFMAFDLPWCAGRSYLDVALEDRKAILRLVLREHQRVRYSGHVERDGVAFFAAAAAQGIEGAMAKHRRSLYEAGRRSAAWLKLKVRPTQEFVVAGYVPGQGSHRDLGALIVGVMEAGRLRYAGRVGSGLDSSTRARLRAALDARVRGSPPFDNAPDELTLTDAAVWVAPDLVIRAEIGGWSRDGIVRQASFANEAPELDPATVERQVAAGPEAAVRALAKAGVALQPGGTTRTAVAGAPGGTALAGVAGVPGGARATRSSRRPAPARLTGQSSGRDAAAAFDPPTAEELDALEGLPARGGAWRIGGRTVTLTNLDKVLAPGAANATPADPGAQALDASVTKRDLVRYLVLVAPVLLPHLAGRALNLARYPNGIEGGFFWQKDIGRGAPDWLSRWREPDPPDRRSHAYVLADSVATLAWLGNQAALEIHPWTSRIEAPSDPRWALVDIDPGSGTTWDETLAIARLFRRALEHLGLTGVPKVTGKRGVQIFVPLRAGYTFDETRAWVEQVSRAVGSAVPELVSWEWSKNQRRGRARLDFTQNWRNRTLVAPYSPRPAPGLPVSTPITWDELDDPALRPDRWTIRTILPRVAERGDLFAAALGPGQELPKL
jgi:bifunctional non-homologous end joining protein LigD